MPYKWFRVDESTVNANRVFEMLRESGPNRFVSADSWAFRLGKQPPAVCLDLLLLAFGAKKQIF